MAKTKPTRSEIDGVQYRTSPMWRIILSQMGQAAIMSFYVITSYVTYMANQGYGIATAVVGIILTCSGIFDGITDPIAAQIIDNTKTRFGRVRVLLAAGFVVISAALILLYNVLSTGNFGIVTFVILYACYFLGYSIYDVVQGTISPLMTNDPGQRPFVGLWNTIFAFIVPMVLMLYFTVALLPKYDNMYTVPMLKEACVIGLIIAFISTVLAMIGVSKMDTMENIEKLETSSERVKFGDMVKMLKENKAMQMFMISVTSDRIALLASGQAVVATLLNGVLLGDIAKATTITTVIQMVAIIFAFIGAGHIAKVGSKESMRVWTIIQMAVTIVLFIFYTVVGIGNIFASSVTTVIFVIIMLLKSGSNMCCNTTVTAMRSDVVDYQNYLTGKYMPAAVQATYSFLDKSIAAFGSSIALGMIALAGYKDVLPQPTDSPTPAIYAIVMFITVFLPIIGWITTLVALKHSPIDKEKMVEVQKVIGERSASEENA